MQMWHPAGAGGVPEERHTENRDWGRTQQLGVVWSPGMVSCRAFCWVGVRTHREHERLEEDGGRRVEEKKEHECTWSGMRNKGTTVNLGESGNCTWE